uniref:Uncharacterized protein n=1 Tax=Clastoptera arizonana TaxID=38151 RepID=A0A1B6DQS2_9HEMI
MRSDVDISIGVELERGKEYFTQDCGQALKKLRNFLIESKGIDEKYLVFIPAKIPILKFIDENTGLKAELSINNELGIENTKLLKLYMKIDLRAKYLCILMKVMARESQMGNRGLSSYAYTLLVIFYLQKCEPPVLPVLQELPNDDDHPQNIIQGYDAYFLNNLENVRSCWPNGEKNVESVSTLWVDLLCFYSERFDFGHQVVSIRQSKPLLKSEKRWFGHNMAIEDPFDVNRNFGVNISRKVNNRIFNMFVNARNRFATATSTNDNLDYYINIPSSTIIH